jgi:hypothetical protein
MPASSRSTRAPAKSSAPSSPAISSPGDFSSLGFFSLRLLPHELEGAPSFAFCAKGGLLRSNVTNPLLCALAFLFSANSAAGVYPDPVGVNSV